MDIRSDYFNGKKRIDSEESDFVFDENQIISSIVNIESDIPEVKLIAMETLKTAVQSNASFLTLELINSIINAIPNEITLQKSMELLGMISYYTSDFSQYLIESNFVDIVSSCFLQFDQKSRSNFYLIMGNVLRDESKIEIEKINLLPLIFQVSEMETNNNYYRLVSTILLNHIVSNQNFISLINILFNPIKKQEQRVKTIRWCLFGIKNSIIDYGSQVVSILLQTDFFFFLLPYLQTEVKTVMIETMELIVTIFDASNDTYAMTNNEFCQSFINLMKTIADEQILAQAALVLTRYVAYCGLNEIEINLFLEVNFVGMFANGFFELKKNLIGLIQQVLPYFPDDYPAKVFPQEFLFDVCEFAFCEDILARISFYKFFGSLYNRYKGQEYIKCLDEVLYSELVNKQINEDALDPENSVSENANMLLTLLSEETDQEKSEEP